MVEPSLLEIVEDLKASAIYGLFQNLTFTIPDLRGDRGPLDKLAAETLASVVTNHCSSDAGNRERILEGLEAVGLLTAWMVKRSREVNNRCSECDAQI